MLAELEDVELASLAGSDLQESLAFDANPNEADQDGHVAVVTVPAGAVGGEHIVITGPGGEELSIELPAGTVSMPVYSMCSTMCSAYVMAVDCI